MNIDSLTYQEKIAWLRLYRGSNIGPVTVHNLLRLCDNEIMQCIEYVENLNQRISSKKIYLETIRNAEIEYKKTLSYGANFLFFSDSNYPYLLKQIYGAPYVLTYKGDLSCIQKKLVSLVGTREPTIYGIKVAEEIALGLSNNEFCIVSGMATGIDSIVHSIAIKNQSPTIAVLGSGIDVPYPYCNRGIYNSLSSGNNGLIITEFPFGSKPKPTNFPRRNRIISGLSLGTCVLQSKKKSGALITANYALDQGRELFAVPGTIFENKNAGGNALLKSGAHLVTSYQDIIDILENLKFDNCLSDSGIFFDKKFKEGLKEINYHESARDIILNLLDDSRTSIEDIVKYSGLGTKSVINALIELEMLEKIRWVDFNSVIIEYDDQQDI